MTRISRQSVLSSTTKIKLLFSVTRPISKLFSQAKGVAADLPLQPVIVYSARSNTLGCCRGLRCCPSSKCLYEQILAQTAVEESKQKREWNLYRPSIFSTRATCAGLPINFPPRPSLRGGSQGSLLAAVNPQECFTFSGNIVSQDRYARHGKQGQLRR